MGGVFCSKDIKGTFLLTEVALKEALVRPNSDKSASFVPISSYSPMGLSDPFDNKFFKRTAGARIGEAITRKVAVGNQWEFADDLCVILPLQKWKLTDPTTGTVLGPFSRGSDDMKDCVSILTVSSNMFIELEHNSLAEYNIFLKEPSGQIIDPVNNKSPSGGQHEKNRKDFTPRPCWMAPSFPGYTPMRREIVRYPIGVTPPSGQYRVRVEKRDDCDSGPIDFRLQVVLDGSVILKQRRMTGGTAVAGDTVAKFRFTI